MTVHSSKKILHRSENNRYAILVVDMLNDFVYGKMKCERAKKIIPKIKSLLEATKETNIPIFYCNDAHLPKDDYEFKLWGPHALKGTKGARIISDLKPSKSSHVVPKRTYSAFYNTKLESLLEREFGKHGPDGIIITGIHTNICAEHTAYDAFVRGFDVIVAEDGVTAFTEKDHKSGIKFMKENYGTKILKTSEIIKMLSKRKSK
jgi:nicotinamidase-related amidase